MKYLQCSIMYESLLYVNALLFLVSVKLYILLLFVTSLQIAVRI